MLTQNHLQAVENMLVNCAGMKAGQTLMIVHEDPAQGYYDRSIVDAVIEGAARLGIRTEVEEVPFTADVDRVGADLCARMAAADATLFLARLGDQLRFRDDLAEMRAIVSYALDGEMLASAFGRTDHRALRALMTGINGFLSGAADVHVTCPLGTDFRGAGPRYPETGGDTSVVRFPLSVFTPAPAFGFAGRVVQQGFLTGTGSRYYAPYSCALEKPVTFHFDGSEITGVTGPERDVEAARAHYENVGRLYRIDPWKVHSWHAGIHPGCAYEKPAGLDLMRWGGGAFGNPRLLHFHTCGDYAPGEISWNILDPTVRVDGVALWERGVLRPERMPGGAEILARFPALERIFQEPSPEVGQKPGVGLSAVV